MMPSKHPQNPSSSSSPATSSSAKNEDDQVPIPPKKPKPTSSASSKKSNPAKPKTTTLKRPLETDPPRKDKTKKKKKKVSDLDLAVVTAAEDDGTEKKSGDDQQKVKLFQRMWTDQDEVLVLKGLLTFKKKGIEPSPAQLFDSIKDSLCRDLNKVQLKSKIRVLKKKYYNALNNSHKPLQDPHEQKLFKLSKKLWGHDDVPLVQHKQHKTLAAAAAAAAASVSENKLNTNKTSETEACATSSGPSTTKGSKLPNGSPVVEVEQQKCVVTHGSHYIYLDQSLAPPTLSVLPVPPPGLVEVFSKRGWNVMGSSKAEGFDKRWRDVLIAQTKAYLERLDLVREQTQAMLDVLKSADE